MKTTTWHTHECRTYEAVMLAWDDVEELLGHAHDGSAGDDAVLVEHCMASGAPDWARTAGGAIDECGWYLIGPEIVDEAAA